MSFVIRRATMADVPTIAHHRVGMFADMGRINDESTRVALIDATRQYLQRAMPAGEFLAWLAVDAMSPDRVVAGAGVQRRQAMPFPISGARATGVAAGAQAVVLNVYTEPEWRRRGIARALMVEVVAWARLAALDSLVLHATSDGRPLYEQLGFTGTNEMVLVP